MPLWVHWVSAFCIKSTNTATATETPSGNVHILMGCSQTIGLCPLLSVHQHKGSLCHCNPNCSTNKVDRATLGVFWPQPQCDVIELVWKTSSKIKHGTTTSSLFLFFLIIVLCLSVFLWLPVYVLLLHVRRKLIGSKTTWGRSQITPIVIMFIVFWGQRLLFLRVFLCKSNI